MTNELAQYIETEILPTAGIVENGTEPFTSSNQFSDWLKSNLHVEIQPTVENLTAYIFSPNDDIIVKTRRIYLNPVDYAALELDEVSDIAVLPHKKILEVLIFADNIAEPGTFWYLTDDEFMILKSL